MEAYIVKKEEDSLYLFKDDKKVGKISPDATWMKEGDEFTEEEILRDYPIENEKEEVVSWIIKLKGPCGHFH